jgi:hypothetical protein
MILRIKEKTYASSEPNAAPYDPRKPETLFTLAKEKGAQSIVDGGSALRGLSNSEMASFVLKHQPASSQVKGVKYFDAKGNIQVMTSKGPVDARDMELKPRKTAMALDQGGSRGANIIIDPQACALMTANGQMSLDAVLQEGGRLRGAGQRIVWAVPQDADLQNIDAILMKSTAFSAREEAENLIRAKKDELRSIVRNAAIQTLLTPALATDDDSALREVISLYARFREDKEGIFIAEKEVDYRKAGSYFEKNKHLHKKDKRPEVVLQNEILRFSSCAERLGLDQAKTELQKIRYPNEILSQMPDFIEGGEGANLDQNVEVEQETQTNVETQVELQTQVQGQRNLDYFPEWIPRKLFILGKAIDHPDFKEHTLREAVHPAYDPRMTFTENFIPISRKEYDPGHPEWHRTPYDADRNALHWLFCILDHKGNVIKVAAIDNLEAKSLYPLDSHYSDSTFCYNFRNDRMLFNIQAYDYSIEENKDAVLQKLAPLVAQWRFFEKQMNEKDYTKDQWEALKQWIAANPELEKEFCKGLSKEKLASYKHSALYKLVRGSASPS